MAKIAIYQPLVKDLLLVLNPLPKAYLRLFYQFFRTDPSKEVLKKIFEDVLDTLWIENMFTLITSINRTDSEVIWTHVCEDIDYFSKIPQPPP